jgi:hypothetical protein
MTLPYYDTAAIDTSNTTVGFADSNLYGMTPADIDRTLDEMQAMGVNDVRILLPWALMEPVPGYDYWATADYIVNAADARGMGVLGVLNSTPSWAIPEGQPASYSTPPASNAQLADFASAVASRYAGKVSAYEVWNEPNSFYGWSPTPDAAAYTEMLQTVYPAIKAADPNATVVGGVLISVTDYGDLTVNPINYLNQMYAAGAQGSFDALSFHPYQFTLPFSLGVYFGDAAPIVQMERMHEIMVANGDGDKLIWSTEYGTPTSVVDEATQAAMIQDYLSSWSQLDYAGPSFIYTTRDINTASTNPDDTFGVLRDDWSWKPAVYVIQQWTATHPQQPMPVDLVAAMRSLAPTTPVAVDSTSGALMTIDQATGAPVPVTTLAAATVAPATSPRATSPTLSTSSTDAVDVPSANPTMVPVLRGAQVAVPATTSAVAAAVTAPATQAATVPNPSVPRRVDPSRTRDASVPSSAATPAGASATSAPQPRENSRNGERAGAGRPQHRSEQSSDEPSNTRRNNATQAAAG